MQVRDHGFLKDFSVYLTGKKECPHSEKDPHRPSLKEPWKDLFLIIDSVEEGTITIGLTLTQVSRNESVILTPWSILRLVPLGEKRVPPRDVSYTKNSQWIRYLEECSPV